MAYSSARVDAAIDGANSATTHIQLHAGDPGAGGTANVAAQVAGRLAFVFPASSSEEAVQTAEFSITATGDGAYTHVTGWNQSTTGTHQWTAALTPQETFAGPGTLTVTVTASGSST